MDFIIFAAGPLIAFPPTIGDMAIFCAEDAIICSRICGTARIGSIETNGLLGAKMMKSDSLIAFKTPGAGVEKFALGN